jgi:hypothetical protein
LFAVRNSRGSLGLALIDFNRNGYTATWNPEEASNLHTAAAGQRPSGVMRAASP